MGRKVCGNKCSASCMLESQNSNDNARDMTSACARVGPASGAERCMIKRCPPDLFGMIPRHALLPQVSIHNIRVVKR